MSTTSANDKAGKMIDQASHSAHDAINSTQQAAGGVVDSAANSLQDLREKAAPVLDRATERVTSMAHRGIDSVRETSHQLRVKAEHASDTTVGYIREEPMKSVLIAAATGAALMALVSLVARSRDRG